MAFTAKLRIKFSFVGLIYVWYLSFLIPKFIRLTHIADSHEIVNNWALLIKEASLVAVLKLLQSFFFQLMEELEIRFGSLSSSAKGEEMQSHNHPPSSPNLSIGVHPCLLAGKFLSSTLVEFALKHTNTRLNHLSHRNTHHPPCVYVQSLSDWYFISACTEPFCTVWLGWCIITGH